ncbi:DUF2851 family protein [Ruficoccus amylovorans]|uniref:DUF2851 family protein n=1 Tax=Ruficoccus amylovorans TaxID=1804625 RepID=A0A842HBD4_9BACT|nr:DUF2851 family protein [Ruficoccus amylovorans]MBC2593725.1 DUF2851 family protein [Ruficoccus amylovorans]
MKEKKVRAVEIQGEYGAVTVSERVLQKIWQRGDFRQERLRTLEGQRLAIRRRGRWNHYEGPDFREAELMLDGEKLEGDVEVHFYPQDWFLHGHDRDPGFDRVALHVCLFPPLNSKRPAVTSGGHWPPTLVLLDRLEQDLESYASEEALLALEKTEQLAALEVMLAARPEDRLAELRERAGRRWRQKAAFARQRLSRMEWDQACHLTALEVLGYRRNRAPMTALAGHYPPEEMRGRSAEELFSRMKGEWALTGLRPPNHPKRRLAQYLELLDKRPDWPQRLIEWGLEKRLHCRAGAETGVERRRGLSAARQVLAEDVLAGTVGGSRFDTLAVDAFLPLLAVKTGAELFAAWFHWWVGDMPDTLKDFLRQAEITGPGRPAANGWAQGGWQLLLESGL